MGALPQEIAKSFKKIMETRDRAKRKLGPTFSDDYFSSGLSNAKPAEMSSMTLKKRQEFVEAFFTSSYNSAASYRVIQRPEAMVVVDFNDPVIEDLARWATLHGGRIAKVDESTWHHIEHFRPTISHAPFSSKCGVVWETKEIIYTESISFRNIVHEMGHIFISKVPPKESTDVSWFGWEYLIAKFIGIEALWLRVSSLSFTTIEDQERTLGWYAKTAEWQGFARDGVPLAIR